MNMHAPRSIKALRFNKKTYDIQSVDYQITSLEYLNRVMQEIVVSEKYILRRDFLVINVNKEADKQKMKLALEAISNGNKVVGLTSSIRKPYLRKRFETSAYKRMFVRFQNQFDLTVFSGGVS